MLTRVYDIGSEVVTNVVVFLAVLLLSTGAACGRKVAQCDEQATTAPSSP